MSLKSFRGLSSPAAVVVLGVILALADAPPLRAEQKEWPLITTQEKAYKECPQLPGASAVYLYREEVRDEEQGETRIFRRIKVLTAAGRDRADIEIPYSKGYTKVVDLEARVVPENGSPRYFGGQVFDKTAIRGPGIRVAVKSFALPGVTPGSIIEYRYKLVSDDRAPKGKIEDFLDALDIGQGKPPEGDIGKGMKLISFPAEIWDVQDDLFTSKAKFVYIKGDFWQFLLSFIFEGRSSLMWFTKRIPDARPVWSKGQLELVAENIPPFEAEEMMPPEDSEKMGVNIFYFDSEFKDQAAYWKVECANWQKAAEGFIGKPAKMAPEVGKILEGIEDPVAKLRKLYERAQRVRNLSYQKRLTSQQRKEQKLKYNRNAADVLARDYGYRSDVTRLFIAMARAAGFAAEPVRVSTRDDKLFQMKYLAFTEQLDSEMALVKVNDRELLFDPATPFCPFGLVHWSRTSTAAVRYSDNPPAFFMTTIYPPDLALTQRELALAIDAEGRLAGTVKTTYQGHEALIRRLEFIHDDREEVRKSLEEEMAELLPMGSTATLKKMDNIDNNADAVIVEYDVVIPGLVTSAGDRILLPASPLLGAKHYPFRHAQRKYPVYFPYPFREFNDIIITLPEGTAVETRPEVKKSQLDNFSYTLVCVQEGPQKVHIQRDLIVKKSYFPVDQYTTVKAFYDSVRSNDEEQLVLAKDKK
jgi:hypothetical protein